MLQDLAKLDCASIILIDILDFADINDFFGIESGDQVLSEFSHRVQQECVGKPLQLYRLHGDQLALLLQDSCQLSELESLAKQLIERIGHTPFLIMGGEIAVHVTCGIAWNLKNPLLEADIALKQAKKQPVGLCNQQGKYRHLGRVEKKSRLRHQDKKCPAGQQDCCLLPAHGQCRKRKN